MVKLKNGRMLLIKGAAYVAAFLALLSCGCYRPPPTDEKMIQTFVLHKDVFDELLTMITKSGYSTISMDPEWCQRQPKAGERWPSSDSKVPADLKRRYFPLMRRINVVQLQSGNGSTSFEVFALGDYKKYQYRPEKVENLVESLDNLGPNEDRTLVIYHRKIADDWFLEYDDWHHAGPNAVQPTR